MKKQNKLMALINKGIRFADEHQREIMLGSAIAGTIVTAALSWKAGIKADKVLSEQREKMDTIVINMGEDESNEISEEEEKQRRKEITLETIKRMAPIVTPPALAATCTIISVIAGYKVASTQIATLSALYSMGEKALSEYQGKVTEIAGPKKAQEIEEAVAKGKVEENPPTNMNTVIDTGKGNVKFYDPKSGRYFYSSPESVKTAFNKVNKLIMDEYFLSLNEGYNELGLPDIELGDEMGFNVDDGLIDIDHLFTVILGSDDRPIYVLNYDISTAYTEHRGKMFR